MFSIRFHAKAFALSALVALVAWRAVDVVRSLQHADEHALLAFPLTVVFPTVLVVVLLLMPPTETREGLLMRVGTAIQLLLIVALPAFALHLALGMPVVFLVVELFETKTPAAFRHRLAALVVA